MPPKLGKPTKRPTVDGEEPLEYQNEFSGPKVDLCLIFDLDAVISSAPFPIIRRYTEHIISTAVDRVCQSKKTMVDGSSNVCRISIAQARNALGNLFLDTIRFIKATGATASYQQLEIGVVRRLEYIQKAKVEFMDMLAMICGTDEEFETILIRYAEMKHQEQDTVKRHVNKKRLQSLRSKMSILREHPLLAKELRNLYDPECILCVIEKTPLRKNVLNMLHFLRRKSREDIKIGVVTNSWETEGEYISNQISLEKTGASAFLTGSCPNEYEPQRTISTSSFDINNLFDLVVQSHMLGENKPQKSTFLHAVEGLTGSKVVGKEFAMRESTSKGKKSAESFTAIDKKKLLEDELSSTMLFTFENRAANAKAALSIGKPYITDSFIIQNGPKDVYRYVSEAVKRAGTIDSRWSLIFNEMEKDIAPLFGVGTGNNNNVPPKMPAGNDTSGVSWVQMEVSNADGNLLFLPHPPDPRLLPPLVAQEDPDLEDQEKTNILTYFRTMLPQYFPLAVDSAIPKGIPLWEAPSVATSCGPVLFERYASLRESHVNTYRVSLRTGCYVLRLSRKGKADIVHAPDALGMKSKFEMTRHLDLNSSVPVPMALLYASDKDPPGREFYLVRHADGRVVGSVKDLIYHSFSRPFSQRRVMSQQTLRPRLFIDAAVDLLVGLHCAAIPDFMKERAKRKGSMLVSLKAAASNGGCPDASNHPIMSDVVNHWSKFIEEFNIIAKVASTSVNVKSTKTDHSSTPLSGEAHNLRSIAEAVPTAKAIEFLRDTIRTAFTTKSNTDPVVPHTTSMCLIHGNYSLGALMFSHRSLEGRPKYPPDILQVLNLQGCNIGDPLIDLARLSLALILPIPQGIDGLEDRKVDLWPSVEELVGSYCAKMADMTTSPAPIKLPMEKLLKVFPVYQAAMCLQVATGLLLETVNTKWEAKRGGPVNMTNQLTLAQKIAGVGVKLMGIEMPPAFSKL